ncbi:hypothetical protein, partial [Phaeovulum sp. NW3]|uniref:hypothetical protein n=1 Tax=Phaeovulum sp. NW3 TaxID=2934933 RepID=UPI002021E365
MILQISARQAACDDAAGLGRSRILLACGKMLTLAFAGSKFVASSEILKSQPIGAGAVNLPIG